MATNAQPSQNPYGTVDFSAPAPGRIFIAGYALDPSNISAPVTAMFTVNGAVAGFASANQPSPELAAYGVSAPHGIDTSIAVSATTPTVTVCMFLFNIGAGADSLAQCEVVELFDESPDGGVSATYSSTGDINVTAYAFDPSNYGQSLGIWIVDNGVLKVARTANDAAPSLAPYGIPGAHGASMSYFAGTLGKHDICVYAVNIGLGSNTWVACTSVNVTSTPGFHNPRGDFGVTDTNGGVSVAGWAYDGSDMQQAATAMWVIDGAVVGYSTANLPSASLALPGNHGTVARLAATPGSHSVCMFVGNIGAGTSQLAKCATVTVGSGWVLPVTNARFTSCYCARWGTFHNGIDLAAPSGTPMYAAADGVVVSAGPANGYGNLIVIKHPATGIYTAYAHMYTVGVYVGQYVTAGQQIAQVGAYGNVTGPHLHFETWWGPNLYQNRIDPAVWLRDHGVQLPPYQG